MTYIYTFLANPSKALDSFRGVFYSTLLGRILEPVFQDVNNKNEAAMNYLNDFLHMKYKATVDGELEVSKAKGELLVTERLRAAAHGCRCIQ